MQQVEIVFNEKDSGFGLQLKRTRLRRPCPNINPSECVAAIIESDQQRAVQSPAYRCSRTALFPTLCTNHGVRWNPSVLSLN